MSILKRIVRISQWEPGEVRGLGYTIGPTALSQDLELNMGIT
jgi:hypothetical protein